MTPLGITVRGIRHTFPDLRTLLAHASPARSGDSLAGIAAPTAQARAIAQLALAELPLTRFLHEPLIPPELDEVTRLILETHDPHTFAPIATLTVGELRDWLLSPEATPDRIAALSPALTPEMAAAVSKLMRLQDLVLVARKIHVITRFRTTLGLPGRLATRLQPNHPTDDPAGIAVSLLDGLLLGSGDAVLGINPVTDNVTTTTTLLQLLAEVRQRYRIPTQNCVLAHITTQMQALRRGAPLDLLFQSIAGTEAANRSFGVSLALLDEAQSLAAEHPPADLPAGLANPNRFYFETGQGSALSANAHHLVDQQTLEARAYAVARRYHPLLVNTVVGFIGPEYLYNGKQILRAGLEDHLCGKLLGLPMGCDICYTNHAEADSDDADALLTLLGAAGVNYIMGVPGADDIMLNYQSTSFHDALYLRQLLNLQPAPEFQAWLADPHFAQLTLAATTSPNPARSLAPQTASSRPEQDAVLRRGETPALRDARAEATSQPPTEQPTQPTTTTNQPPRLRHLTAARVALGRTGSSLRTADQLAFQLDHALARDAVLHELDTASLLAALHARNLPTLTLTSAAHQPNTRRRAFLQRPDLGRRLSPDSATLLRQTAATLPQPPDLVFLLADGLSSLAVERHALPLLDATLAILPAGLHLGPICLVRDARVALADEAGALLNAAITAILIGERPGLSAPDSLGVYITWAPRPGRTDAERNCISNIRANGLPYPTAANTLLHTILQARQQHQTGVDLKAEALPHSLASKSSD